MRMGWKGREFGININNSLLGFKSSVLNRRRANDLQVIFFWDVGPQIEDSEFCSSSANLTAHLIRTGEALGAGMSNVDDDGHLGDPPIM